MHISSNDMSQNDEIETIFLVESNALKSAPADVEC